MNHPRIAIVGHPNKGKSSLVSTMAEDDSVHISPISGTTLENREYPMQVDGETLYSLIDTPGFQRTRETLEWLKLANTDTASRKQTIRQFIDTHRNNPHFSAETQLLSPIIEGAGILYVVDGSRPFGVEYEAEMEILRWTGQASMALINMISETGDYSDEWRSILEQYFKIVRIFNPLTAPFERKIALLQGFSHLNDAWHQPLERAASVLKMQRQRQRNSSAQLLAELLESMLTLKLTQRLSRDQADSEIEASKTTLNEQFKQKLVALEQDYRRTIERLYQHHQLSIQNEAHKALDLDLFSDRSWTVFGLDQTQLLTTSVAGGAIAGGVIDLAVGGSSLFLGAGIGAAAAGLSAWFSADKLAKTTLLGTSLGGQEISVGPIQNRNFPYIVLSRCLVHHQLVDGHSHADRRPAKMDESALLSKNTEIKARIPFEKIFSAYRKPDIDNAASLRKTLSTLIQTVISDSPEG